MSQILTFLGESSAARTKIAIASAKYEANQGKRVLLASGAEPVLPVILGADLGPILKKLALIYKQYSFNLPYC